MPCVLRGVLKKISLGRYIYVQIYIYIVVQASRREGGKGVSVCAVHKYLTTPIDWPPEDCVLTWCVSFASLLGTERD